MSEHEHGPEARREQEAAQYPDHDDPEALGERAGLRRSGEGGPSAAADDAPAPDVERRP